MADSGSTSAHPELILMFQQQMSAQQEQPQQQMEAMMAVLADKSTASVTGNVSTNIPSFSAFDPMSELWTDYWSRFQTFLEAHAVPESRQAKVILTNQSAVSYKLIDNMARQFTPLQDINSLTVHDIAEFMKDQYHPKRSIDRERYKFCSEMKHKPGETIQELVARIRQDAVTCDFA